MELFAKNIYFSQKHTINCSGKLFDLSKPVVMGILNITPDSFFDGGNYTTESLWLPQAEKMLSEGASIIDIGALSTRPGAKQLTEKDELDRLIPAIASIRKYFPQAVISVDTYRSSVATAAVEHGADIINDISAGTLDDMMFEAIAALRVPYIMMHIKGSPENMQQDPVYDNVLNHILKFFSERIYQLKLLGFRDIIIDPGFGFGKTVQHNYELLNHLKAFRVFDLPIMVGLSRKSMINRVLNILPDKALNGTTALNTIALMKGANILRVHDVKPAIEAIKLVHSLHN